MVPRFSALALVSVGLIALTGVYSDWVQTRDLLGFGTPYQLNLLVKILVFVLALAVGLLNYLDGGRDLGRRFGLSRRLLLELILGVAVLAITANLTSGSPTGRRPVAIAARAEHGRLGRARHAGRSARTARPEPVRRRAADAARRGNGRRARPPTTRPGRRHLPDHDAPRLQHRHADLRGRREPPGREPLGRDGRRDRTGGADIARQRFVFALDTDGISEGRATPPLDPGLTVALLLLVLGVVGLGYALAGGTLPRTSPTPRAGDDRGERRGPRAGLAALVLGGPR